jgi:Fic family protein
MGVDGRVDRTYNYFAFLVDPLPVSLPLRNATWTLVAQAEAALGRLDAAANQVPNPQLLRRPSLRREAHSTSALEGTFAPLADVLESELDDPRSLTADVREILNYTVAAEIAFDWVVDRPITIGFICELQRSLVTGTTGERPDTGQLREIQVFIGAQHRPIEEARFVPAPPGDQVRVSMEDWVRWAESPPHDLSPVVQAALTHYQFEAVHPFSDGNGRIGRLLVVLLLIRRGVLTFPLLEISPWLETHRSEYLDELLNLSVTGDWDAWIAFFARALAAAAAATLLRIRSLVAWQEDAVSRAQEHRVAGLAERLVRELISTPVLGASRVAEQHHVSHQGALKALRRLVAAGIVDEVARGGRVIFVAREVLDIISGP